MIGTMDGLANAAKTSAGGMPNLLQLAMIGRDCRTSPGTPSRRVRAAGECSGCWGPRPAMRLWRDLSPVLTPPRRHHPRSGSAPARRAGTTGPDDLTRTRP